MAVVIETRELEINELLDQAANQGGYLNMRSGSFPKGSADLLEGKNAGLSCVSALCECYQEFLNMFSAVQELYAEEIAMAKNAVATIAEADRAAARNIEQA